MDRPRLIPAARPYTYYRNFIAALTVILQQAAGAPSFAHHPGKLTCFIIIEGSFSVHNSVQSYRNTNNLPLLLVPKIQTGLMSTSVWVRIYARSVSSSIRSCLDITILNGFRSLFRSLKFKPARNLGEAPMQASR